MEASLTGSGVSNPPLHDEAVKGWASQPVPGSAFGCALLLAALLVPYALAQQPKTVTVGKSAKANFATLQAALDAALPEGETIRMEQGAYREKVHITTPNIHLIGLGKTPAETVITWNDSAKSAGGTGKSGSVTITADGFEAENLTIENTWEKENARMGEGSQAVALLIRSDRSVLDRVRLIGAQDTLYADSLTCHLPETPGAAPAPGQAACRASREFFHDCYIEGHVDFIFGDAKAVFEDCELHGRKNPTVMLTAQSRHYPEEDSGYTFLHTRVTGDEGIDKMVLGRPWRDYSTVLFYDTDFENKIAAEGWSEWGGRLKTSTYREYKSHGPGVNGGQRAVTYPELTKAEEKTLTPRGLLGGTDNWNPEAEVKRLRAVE